MTCRNSDQHQPRKARWQLREALAEEYGLKAHQVALYLRVHQLFDPLKIRLDNNEFSLSAADLSFLKTGEQKSLDKCMELNSFKADVKKATILRKYSERGKLDEDKIYLS